MRRPLISSIPRPARRQRGIQLATQQIHHVAPDRRQELPAMERAGRGDEEALAVRMGANHEVLVGRHGVPEEEREVERSWRGEDAFGTYQQTRHVSILTSLAFSPSIPFIPWSSRVLRPSDGDLWSWSGVSGGVENDCLEASCFVVFLKLSA